MAFAKGKRLYLIGATAGLLSLAGVGAAAAATAHGPAPQGRAVVSVQTCENQAADTTEADAQGVDADNIDLQCGDQQGDSASDTSDAPQSPAGTLDDGKELLPQAGITIEQAISAAQTAATGAIGEVDLEQANGTLVFNVDVGDRDVQVDAATGSVVSSAAND